MAEKFGVNEEEEEEEEREEREESNPCSRWPPVCGQVCISGGGEGEESHRCDCVQGYVPDPQDTSQCKPSEGHPSILFAHKSDVRKLSLDRPSMTAIVNNTRLDLTSQTSLLHLTPHTSLFTPQTSDLKPPQTRRQN